MRGPACDRFVCRDRRIGAGSIEPRCIERDVYRKARAVGASYRTKPSLARGGKPGDVIRHERILWGKRDLPAASTAEPSAGRPWLVFCSPPYAFYQERQAETLDLIARVQEYAPAGSILIIEADELFKFDLLLGRRSEQSKRCVGYSRVSTRSRWSLAEAGNVSVGGWVEPPASPQ